MVGLLGGGVRDDAAPVCLVPPNGMLVVERASVTPVAAPFPRVETAPHGDEVLAVAPLEELARTLVADAFREAELVDLDAEAQGNSRVRLPPKGHGRSVGPIGRHGIAVARGIRRGAGRLPHVRGPRYAAAASAGGCHSKARAQRGSREGGDPGIGDYARCTDAAIRAPPLRLVGHDGLVTAITPDVTL